ncbi:MAG: rRNA maturation RNase YbeY [Bacteroidales bacterium]
MCTTAIDFFEEDAHYPRTFQKDKICKVISNIISTETTKELDFINIILCSDENLYSINTRYLEHFFYTDIITFDYSESTIASDMYISLDRIIDNATKNSVTLQNELDRIIIHGTLHLAGYKDTSQKDKKIMTSKENEYLQLI